MIPDYLKMDGDVHPSLVFAWLLDFVMVLVCVVVPISLWVIFRRLKNQARILEVIARAMQVRGPGHAPAPSARGEGPKTARRP
jgi:hypothetical protein